MKQTGSTDMLVRLLPYDTSPKWAGLAVNVTAATRKAPDPTYQPTPRVTTSTISGPRSADDIVREMTPVLARLHDMCDRHAKRRAELKGVRTAGVVHQRQRSRALSIANPPETGPTAGSPRDSRCTEPAEVYPLNTHMLGFATRSTAPPRDITAIQGGVSALRSAASVLLRLHGSRRPFTTVF